MTRRLAALALGAGAAAAACAAAARLPSTVRSRWARTNHAGREVTLLEGPAHALGLAAAGCVAGPAPVLAAVAGAGFGALDDLTGDTAPKGLRGHLAAARRGTVTTGLVKIGGLALTGLAAAALTDRHTDATPASGATAGAAPGATVGAAPRAGALGILSGGAVIAGCANLLNLFDLRPGRALKVGLLLGGPLALRGDRAGTVAAGAVGAALGVMPADLRGESMLGDTGANALGAVLGVALIDGRSTRARLGTLAVLTALTLASERVSFTRVIESTPVLRELDAWGRRRA